MLGGDGFTATELFAAECRGRGWSRTWALQRGKQCWGHFLAQALKRIRGSIDLGGSGAMVGKGAGGSGLGIGQNACDAGPLFAGRSERRRRGSGYRGIVILAKAHALNGRANPVRSLLC